MAQRDDQIVSAQVVLRPATPRRSRAPVTSENVADVLPSREAAALARQVFERAGFELGALVGNSFSITGPMRLFNKVMHTRLQLDPRTKAMKAVRPDGAGVIELPLGALPSEVASVIEAVTFTPPPDFGPTNY